MKQDQYNRTKDWAHKFLQAYETYDVEAMVDLGIPRLLAEAQRESFRIQHEELKEELSKYPHLELGSIVRFPEP